MTGLLVSVRSAAEAEIALAGGADLIDVKEPSRGPLGAADPEVWEDVRKVVAGRVPTSVALGELLADPVHEWVHRCAGFQYAKIGLSGSDQYESWQSRWIELVKRLPRGVTPVPVAYADCQRAASGPIARHQAWAATLPGELLVIDTFDKSAGNLLSHVGVNGLLSNGQTSRKFRGLRLVLAGSLDVEAIESLLHLAPAWFGVRGAVCRGGRGGAIDLALVKRLAELVHSTSDCARNQIG